MRNKFAILMLMSCFVLAGCDTMRVNGLSMRGIDRITGLASGNDNQNFCQQNPGLCVAGAIITGAIITGIIANNRKSKCGGGPGPRAAGKRVHFVPRCGSDPV